MSSIIYNLAIDDEWYREPGNNATTF